MAKTTFSIFFTLIFTMFIVSPLIVFVMDASEEVAMHFSVNDEEGKKKETAKDTETKITDDNKRENDIIELNKENSMEYYFKNYDALYLQLLSPPPEL